MAFEQRLSGSAILKLVIVAVITVTVLIASGSVVENVGAGEIVVKQSIGGTMEVWTEPGPHGQWFGTTTHYHRSAQYWFSAKAGADGAGINVQFNDGGKATISGSMRYELPVEKEALLKLHAIYGNQEAIERQLVRTVADKAVFMSGPLLSSQETYAARRGDLISFIGDQVAHGVYKTESEAVRETDPLSGQEKSVTRVRLIKDDKTGQVGRQEASPLETFKIATFNFTIDEIVYDGDVEKQIKQQQKAIMDVQTAMAEAKKAEQRVITVGKEGEAKAAEAKWAQEVIKAQAVTEGEQQKAVALLAAERDREVAKLGMEAAEFKKKEQILLGEGEGARKKAAMLADGALTQKLAAWVEVQKAYAEQMGKQPLVPQIVLGGSDGRGGNDPAVGIMELMRVRAARELALDMRMGTGH